MITTDELTLTVPGLIFPAISLLFLSYTNKFLTLATLIRTLHSSYQENPRDMISMQIANLRRRLLLIKHMQGAGIMSFILCVASMLLIYLGLSDAAVLVFGGCLLFLLTSLILCAIEIHISIEALDLQIQDMELVAETESKTKNRQHRRL